MSIVGLDVLVFGVNDLAVCSNCLPGYGLVDGENAGGSQFEAVDDASIILRCR